MKIFKVVLFLSMAAAYLMHGINVTDDFLLRAQAQSVPDSLSFTFKALALLGVIALVRCTPRLVPRTVPVKRKKAARD